MECWKKVHLLQADMNNKESVIAAIRGSSAVFAVTNYWEKMSAEMEIEQGKVMADASKAAGVERFFWSSLPHVSKGNLHCRPELVMSSLTLHRITWQDHIGPSFRQQS